jgi:hypothetical protein
MGDRTGRAAWGAGRVAFLARLETISSELREGHSLTTIFERHRLALAISYPSFCRLASQFAADARPARVYSPRAATPNLPVHSSAPATAATSATPSSNHAQQQGSDNAGQYARPRGFNHDPLERPDDRKRLLGEE